MASSSDRLETLKQKQQALADQIRREKKKLAEQERQRETRRKILIGAILQKEAEKDEALAQRIHALLKSNLTRADDRALFELEPLPEASEDQKKAASG